MHRNITNQPARANLVAVGFGRARSRRWRPVKDDSLIRRLSYSSFPIEFIMFMPRINNLILLAALTLLLGEVGQAQNRVLFYREQLHHRQRWRRGTRHF